MQNPDSLFHTLRKALLVAASLVVLLWVLHQIQGVVLLFFFALVLAIALNAPVTWLESKRLSRTAAALAVGVAVLATLVALGWMVGPRLAQEVVQVVQSVPSYAQGLSNRLVALLRDYPELQARVTLSDENLALLTPWALGLLNQAWGWGLALLTIVVILIVMASVIVYLLIDPQPLLSGYLRAWPEHHRVAATRAFVRSSEAVVGWMRSNVIVGSMKAVAVFFFLSWMDVPGALVWAALALFAEMVPNFGPYIMSIPPVLVSLSVDPGNTPWVLLFLWLLNELMGNVVTPRIRATTMKLHPVFTMFIALAMVSAFGLLGALVATPLAGFVKAYYDEFYLATQRDDVRIPGQVDAMLRVNKSIG